MTYIVPPVGDGRERTLTDEETSALRETKHRNTSRNPLEILRGSVLRYVDPLTPVDVEWEAAE